MILYCHLNHKDLSFGRMVFIYITTYFKSLSIFLDQMVQISSLNLTQLPERVQWVTVWFIRVLLPKVQLKCREISHRHTWGEAGKPTNSTCSPFYHKHLTVITPSIIFGKSFRPLCFTWKTCAHCSTTLFVYEPQNNHGGNKRLSVPFPATQ